MVTIDQVAGTARKPYHQRFHARAHHLTQQVGQAVDAWFDGAFVGVHYPTASYPDAFTPSPPRPSRTPSSSRR